MSPVARTPAKAKRGRNAASKKPHARKPKGPKKPKPIVLTYSRPEMKRLLEAILFASDRPVPASQLGGILNNSPEEEVRAALAELSKEYEEWGRSFVLKEVGGGFLLYSHPSFEPWVRKLFRGRLTLRLSKSALETIAIIAYRQPVTKQEIEVIRGVNADGVLHTLLERKLIRVTGRKEGMGRALLYGTTTEFLQYMGLNDLTELPQIEEMKTILEAQEAPGAEGIVEPQGPFASRLQPPAGTAAPSATDASTAAPAPSSPESPAGPETGAPSAPEASTAAAGDAAETEEGEYDGGDSESAESPAGSEETGEGAGKEEEGEDREDEDGENGENGEDEDGEDEDDDEDEDEEDDDEEEDGE